MQILTSPFLFQHVSESCPGPLSFSEDFTLDTHTCALLSDRQGETPSADIHTITSSLHLSLPACLPQPCTLLSANIATISINLPIHPPPSHLCINRPSLTPIVFPQKEAWWC
ncbi:hypothetical protein BC829DRAFT_102116 [Chytridium lagenaria]|nr:hypothetical protein BC829DRAFT_102116 [Chytridium lagenaria]